MDVILAQLKKTLNVIGENQQRRLYEKKNPVADALIEEYTEISAATLTLMRRWAILMDSVANTVEKKDIIKNDRGTFSKVELDSTEI